MKCDQIVILECLPAATPGMDTLMAMFSRHPDEYLVPGGTDICRN